MSFPELNIYGQTRKIRPFNGILKMLKAVSKYLPESYSKIKILALLLLQHHLIPRMLGVHLQSFDAHIVSALSTAMLELMLLASGPFLMQSIL